MLDIRWPAVTYTYTMYQIIHLVHILYVPDPRTNQKVEIKGEVYMMLCERARTAVIAAS